MSSDKRGPTCPHGNISRVTCNECTDQPSWAATVPGEPNELDPEGRAADYGAPCPHVNASGEPISCSEADRLHEQDRHHARAALTLTEAGHLADLFRAQERHDRLYWYPCGAEHGAAHASYVIRAFTHEGGGLWFDKDGDVRDAYLWLSGIGELWLKVSDIIRALENVIDARHGEGEPMARIEARS